MKPALLNLLLSLVAGTIFLAGCAGARSSQTNTSERNHLLARLRASERVSLQIEGQMVAARQRLAASYPAGTVTVPGEVVDQNDATDELATKLQDLRTKLEKSRQEQQQLRTKLRRANGPNPPSTKPILEPPAA